MEAVIEKDILISYGHFVASRTFLLEIRVYSIRGIFWLPPWNIPHSPAPLWSWNIQLKHSPKISLNCCIFLFEPFENWFPLPLRENLFFIAEVSLYCGVCVCVYISNTISDISPAVVVMTGHRHDRSSPLVPNSAAWYCTDTRWCHIGRGWQAQSACPAYLARPAN